MFTKRRDDDGMDGHPSKSAGATIHDLPRNCPSNVLPDSSWRYWASFVVVGVSVLWWLTGAVSDSQRWASLESRCGHRNGTLARLSPR
ncbi:MAG: hypothetical protein IPK27_23545 [Rhodanobacteraceae bacterium]|nr:hypothetical protein [Rhodanobacteraceae bacterium]